MDALDGHALSVIARHLSRPDCVRWSWVSSHWSQRITHLCHLRLTTAQAEVVERILQLDSEDWRTSVSRASTYATPFPERFALSTGTSTGKTAIALYAAARLVQRGLRVLFSIPLRLLPQWRAEYDKFRERFNLPPLFIAHNSFQRDWHSQAIPQRCLLFASSHTVNSTHRRFDFAREHPNSRFAQECKALREIPWNVWFLDEASKVQEALYKFSVRAQANGVSFYGLTLNASIVGRKRKHTRTATEAEETTQTRRHKELVAPNHDSSTLASYAVDEQLGRLPVVQTTVDFTMPHKAAKRIRLFLPWVNRGMPDSERIAEERLFLARARARQAFAREWLLRHVLPLCGEKTIILCDAKLSSHLDKNGYRVDINMLEVLSAEDIAEHTLAPVFNLFTCKGPKRALMVNAFLESKRGIILSPIDYLMRGFNLHVDTAIAISPTGALSAKIMLQLRGRVCRVESPYRVVSLHILISDEPNRCFTTNSTNVTLPATLLARHIAFHALVRAIPETGQLLRSVERFESNFLFKHYVTHEFSRIDVHKYTEDSPLDDVVDLFNQLYPNIERTLCRAEARRLEFFES